MPQTFNVVFLDQQQQHEQLQYISYYWPNFDEILKLGILIRKKNINNNNNKDSTRNNNRKRYQEEKHQQRGYYWPNFDQTLKLDFLDQLLW